MEILDLFLQSTSSVSLLGSLVVLLLIYFISTSSFRFQQDRMEPPGPKALPLLGNLLQFDLKTPHNTLMKKVVVLAGYKTVKEALVNFAEEFGDRDPMQIMIEFSQGYGITWSNGEIWKEMRRFVMMNLKDFGMGKKVCEDKIIEECHRLIEVLKKFKGEALDMTQPIHYAVSNIICSMVYGNRFEYDDPQFTYMLECMSTRVKLAGSPSIQVYNVFPWFFKWIANRKEFHQMNVFNRKQNLEIFSSLKKTLNPQMCRGLVDAFLVRKQNLKESGITNSQFHNENLMVTVLNLFGGGTDTTATTVRWALMLMAKYPKIQDQVQEELSGVIGSRQVQVEDRKNLHFTNAVIHEIQRLANIAPMGLPHKATKDVTFQGYFIKKGTTVYPLLASVLYDESEWENPHSFYPAHFLDKDGKFVKREAFLPFSAGRRVCPGESLARMELFILFVTLLQHFRFTPPPGVSEDELGLNPPGSLTRYPTRHKLCAEHAQHCRAGTFTELKDYNAYNLVIRNPLSVSGGGLLPTDNEASIENQWIRQNVK
uniref:cytochrome P450 2K4-like isoform X2 n=1 Tax=Epinephelus lanceolatus TaxID=310571 RepID=UPI0014456314|nr:cytochrome P450 2K4-like isoform X2 [Epinephelus lanceolatus]